MSYITTNSYKNITFSIGNFYMSTIMALLIEVLMFDIHMQIISIQYYLVLIFLLVLYIKDNDYLGKMIEYHSIALLTSEKILQKPESEYVK